MRALFATIIALCTSCSVGLAQADTCSKVLVADTIIYESSLEATLSYMHLINKDNYESSKTNLQNGASAIIEVIPISASSTFDQFQQKRTELYAKYEYHYSVSESESYFSQVIGDNSLAAYLACVKQQDQSRTGLHVFAEYYDDSVAILTLYWNPENGNTKKTQSANLIHMAGGAIQKGSQFPNVLKPRVSHSFAVTREANKTLKVFITGGNEPLFQFVVAGRPILKTFCEDLSTADTVIVDVVTDGYKRACNACGDCRPGDVTTDVPIIQTRTMDALCIKKMRPTNQTALVGFDCGWNGWGNKVHDLIYGDDNRLLRTTTPCQSIEWDVELSDPSLRLRENAC